MFSFWLGFQLRCFSSFKTSKVFFKSQNIRSFSSHKIWKLFSSYKMSGFSSHKISGISSRKMSSGCCYHVTYTFQSESTLYKCLNLKELLVQNRHFVWSLGSSIQFGHIGTFCPPGTYFYLGILKHFELQKFRKKLFKSLCITFC